MAMSNCGLPVRAKKPTSSPKKPTSSNSGNVAPPKKPLKVDAATQTPVDFDKLLQQVVQERKKRLANTTASS